MASENIVDDTIALFKIKVTFFLLLPLVEACLNH